MTEYQYGIRSKLVGHDERVSWEDDLDTVNDALEMLDWAAGIGFANFEVHPHAIRRLVGEIEVVHV